MDRMAIRLMIAILVFLLGISVALPTWAASTIDPTQPVSGQPYTSAPIRNNFQAAVNDIQALQKLNGGAIAPVNPSLGTFWLNTSNAASYPLEIWDGTTWVVIAVQDPVNHLWSAPIGGGVLPTLLSAATTDLGTVSAASLYVSGSASIQSFGSTTPTGDIKVTLFTGTATLVQNATSMILPGGANIVQQAGDVSIELALGGGNWNVLFDSRVLQSCSPAAGFLCTKINSQTASYTALSADCGTSIELGGAAFYTLTINSASTYLPNCQLIVINTDISRGKAVVITGIPFILWPQSSFTFYSVGTTWNLPQRARWRLPQSLTFYVDPVNGTDQPAEDCLAPLVSACKTIQGVLNLLMTFVDLNGNTATVSLAPDTTPGDYKPFTVSGSLPGQGNPSSLIITGATNTASQYLLDGQGAGVCATGNNYAAFTLQNITLQNCTVLAGQVAGGWFGHMVLSNVATGFCGAPGGAQIRAADSTAIEIVGSYNIIGSANCANHMAAVRSANILIQQANTGPTVATITTNLSYTASFAQAQREGVITFIGYTASPYVLGGNTVTSAPFAAIASSSIETLFTGQFFPGNLAPTTADTSTYNPLEHNNVPTFTGGTPCGGGSPSLNAAAIDYRGIITEGTSVTSCVITFAAPFQVAPTCIVTPYNMVTIPANLSQISSPTQLTVMHGSTSGATISYFCAGG